MKYNPRINEVVARLEGLATDHPYAPEPLVQGCISVLSAACRCLAVITGMDAVSLQPAAGAQGELTGILMIRACLADRGDARKYIGPRHKSCERHDFRIRSSQSQVKCAWLH